MSKPLDVFGKPLIKIEPTAEERSARVLYDAARYLYVAAGTFLSALHNESKNHGGLRLLSILSPEEAAGVETLRQAVMQLWDGVSSEEIPPWYEEKPVDDVQPDVQVP